MGVEFFDRTSYSSDRETIEQITKEIIVIPSCDDGCLHGVRTFSKEGFVMAERCSCVDDLPELTKHELQRRSEFIKRSGLPAIFANKLYGKQPFDDVAPTELQQWLDRVCHSKAEGGNHVFLCGKVGTGKTHLASDCVKRFIVKTGYQAIYTTAMFIVEKKRSFNYSQRYRRQGTENEERVALEHLLYDLQRTSLVVIDEIRESLNKHEVSLLEWFIDKRYQNGLPTVFISNHTFHAPTSYKKITIQKVLGDRNGDRLRLATLCEFTGNSKREIRAPNSYTEAEEQMFSFPPSLLALRDDRRQLLNWMTRNPIFEPINRKDRKIALDQEGNRVYLHGVPVDADRERMLVREDVWQKGDRLVMKGPILCEQDAFTYVTCLHLLKERHKSGCFGLSIRVTPTYLMEALGLNSTSGTSKESLHRSLRRISCTLISYGDIASREWTGPLFYFSYQPANPDGAYLIHFNKNMIEFYKSCEYTVLQKELFDAQIGTDGVRMQMFLRSHANSKFTPKDFKGWMKLLDKPFEQMDDTPTSSGLAKIHRRNFAKTIRKQVKAGLLTTDSGLKRDGTVVLNIAPFDSKSVN